jgi:hypothetical protein
MRALSQVGCRLVSGLPSREGHFLEGQASNKVGLVLNHCVRNSSLDRNVVDYPAEKGTGIQQEDAGESISVSSSRVMFVARQSGFWYWLFAHDGHCSSQRVPKAHFNE